MDDLHVYQKPRRKKGEWLGPEIADLTVVRQNGNNQAKIPGIIFKGVFLALAVALLPVLHKQSPQLMGYTNHATIARSWEVINLVVIGLAISYGLISRRPADKAKDPDDLAVAAQGTQNYVQRMFEFAQVFDNFRPPAAAAAAAADDKLETWSSRWQPEEPLVVFAGDGKQKGNDKRVGEQPLLLPIRSLKSSLSNPDVFDFLKDGEVPTSKPTPAAAAVQESGKPREVRNGAIMSVESGNFDEELSNDEPAVFPSPIPWASRLDVLNHKEPHPSDPTLPAPGAINLASDGGKIDLPAIPSPIPWHSRPDHDGKHKISMENGDVSECKPPLPPPQRPPPPPPPPPPEMQKKSVHKGMPPSPSPYLPRPPVGLANDKSQKKLQPSTGFALQKLSSPSPPRSRPELVKNESSQKHPNPKPKNSNEAARTRQNDSVQITPPAGASPSLHTASENGSSEKHHVNGDISRHNIPKDVVPTSDESKARRTVSPPLPPAPSPPAVVQDLGAPKKPLENGLAYRSDSRNKSRDDTSDSRGKAREGSSNASDSRSKSRDVLSHSRRDIAEAELVTHSSRKFPSPPPPLPPVPPPPPPPFYPDMPTATSTSTSTSTSAPLPPCPKDQDRTSCCHDELKHEKKTSSPSELIFQVGGSESDSESESESDTESEADLDANGEEEVDKKADQFIARFHEQIRLQRIDSIRRSKERRERRGRK